VLQKSAEVGKQVIVAENYRFWPAERTIQRLLGEGFLGVVDNAMMIDRRHQPSRTEGPWFGKIQYPQLQEIATHHFDSLRSFVPAQPRDVRCEHGTKGSDFAHGAQTGHYRVRSHPCTVPGHVALAPWLLDGSGGRHDLDQSKFVAFRKPGARLFMPMRNDPCPKG
jgi:predicted dehydrogenase